MKTPYFLFHPKILEQNYMKFYKFCKDTFKNNFKICYSVKTNTNKEVIKKLKKLNSGFEVASLNEIRKTPKKSFRVMNGPAKTIEELKTAIKQNILLQIDSFSEIKKLKKLKIKPKEVMIRISNNSTKFGFEKNQIENAIKELEKIKIEFVGFQMHSSTKNKFSDFEENLNEQKKIISPYLKKIKYLNFGGGIPDNFQLKNLNIKLEDYFQKIKETFKEFKGIFIFEPGRNLVSDSYTLITKVISIKEKDNKNFAILDAGINILSKITLANYKFNHKKINETNSKPKNYILAGPLLFNNDSVGKWYGKLCEGDLFEIENVGAYCQNMAWKIIYGRPKILK